MKRLLPIIFILLLVINVQADGGYFPPYPEPMYEPTQEAVILFNGYRETLIIKPSFAGETNEFAWVVPVPAYPTVEEAETELFRELQRLTRPQYTGSRSFGGVMMAATSAEGDPGIFLHERKQVGIYDTVIMSGYNEENFLWWFQKEGFAVPDNAKPIIREYMNKNWIFVVMKINTEEYEGEIHPVEFKFDSPEPIYPLKISSVNKGASEIHLYAFTEHRVQEEAFAVTYAKQIEPEDILHNYPELNKLLDRGYFLTKLERTMWPADMTYDLVLTKHTTVDPWSGQEKSEEYIPVREEPFNWGEFFALNVVLLVIFGIVSQIFRFVHNKFVKKKEKIEPKRAFIYAIVLVVLLNLMVYSGGFGSIAIAILAIPIYLLMFIIEAIWDLTPMLGPVVGLAFVIGFMGALFYAIHWVSTKLLKK